MIGHWIYGDLLILLFMYISYYNDILNSQMYFTVLLSNKIECALDYGIYYILN